MKLNPLISRLALYDTAGTPGVAVDVSHINTRAEVKGYMVEELLVQPQEELLYSKPVVTALIDELEKLRSPCRLPYRIRSSTASKSRRTSSGAVAKKPYLRLARPSLQASPPSPSSIPRRPVTCRRLSKTFPALDLYYAVHRSYGVSVVRCSTPLASSPPMDILNSRRCSSPLPRSRHPLQPLPLVAGQRVAWQFPHLIPGLPLVSPPLPPIVEAESST